MGERSAVIARSDTSTLPLPVTALIRVECKEPALRAVAGPARPEQIRVGLVAGRARLRAVLRAADREEELLRLAGGVAHRGAAGSALLGRLDDGVAAVRRREIAEHLDRERQRVLIDLRLRAADRERRVVRALRDRREHAQRVGLVDRDVAAELHARGAAGRREVALARSPSRAVGPSGRVVCPAVVVAGRPSPRAP